MSDQIICILDRQTTGDDGTFGEFRIDEFDFACFSIELPNRNNRPMKGRILAGHYTATWQMSKRFRRMTYRLEDANGRTGILIHPGNFAGDVTKGRVSDFTGCIGLGMELTTMLNTYRRPQLASANSAVAVHEFERLCAGRRLLIKVLDE